MKTILVFLKQRQNVHGMSTVNRIIDEMIIIRHFNRRFRHRFKKTIEEVLEEYPKEKVIKSLVVSEEGKENKEMLPRGSQIT